jgi:hypothetical protein
LTLYNDLKDKFKSLAANLKEDFRNIAFVLEDESTAICAEELRKVNDLCDKSIEGVNTFVDTLITNNDAEFIELKGALEEKSERWKSVNRDKSIENYINLLTDPSFAKTT